MDYWRVQWYYLLHYGNVILRKAEFTPETLIFRDSRTGELKFLVFVRIKCNRNDSCFLDTRGLDEHSHRLTHL